MPITCGFFIISVASQVNFSNHAVKLVGFCRKSLVRSFMPLIPAWAKDLLLGRKTYEIFAAHWPCAEGGPEDCFAKTYNSITKYVATRKGLDLT